MKKLILMFLVILFFTAIDTNAQVQITTMSDQEYQGIVVSETVDSLSLRLIDGGKIAVAKSQIKDMQPCETTIKAKIESKSKKPQFKTYNGSLTAITDSSYTIQNKSGISFTIKRVDLKSIYVIPKSGAKSYPMAGLTLFQPGGLNLLIGFQCPSKLGFRLEGGYIGKVYGFQFNLTYNLSKSRTFEHNVSLGVGYSSVKLDNAYYIKETKTWTYAGLFYDFNFYGFFLELGLTGGSGDFSNPQLSIQLGYIYRFNK